MTCIQGICPEVDARALDHGLLNMHGNSLILQTIQVCARHVFPPRVCQLAREGLVAVRLEILDILLWALDVVVEDLARSLGCHCLLVRRNVEPFQWFPL